MLEELCSLQEELRLTDTPSQQGSILSKQLLQPTTCHEFLQFVAKEIQAPNLAVAASLFAKNYAYSLVVSALWTMGIHNKALNLQIDNIQIEYGYEGEHWIPQLRLLDWSVQKLPENRGQARGQVLTTLMRDHLSPLWNTLQKEARISRMILWENTAINIYWLYHEKLKTLLPTELIQRAMEDYHYLVHEMDATLFGERVQPLERFLKDVNPFDRKRKTCCMYFQTCGGQDYCTICPRKNRVQNQNQVVST